MLTTLFLAFQSPLAGTLPPAIASERTAQCLALVDRDGSGARAAADLLARDGGAEGAERCRAAADLATGDAASAARRLAGLARAADATGRVRDAAGYWGQAGNAALIAGDGPGATGHLSQALARATGPAGLGGTAQGLLHLDRARAGALTGAWTAVAADLARARALAPQDPLVWLLTATLARREGRLADAKSALATAAALAPADGAIALEAGNVAWAAGDLAAARAAWTTARTLGGEAGTVAAARLDALTPP